MSDAIRRIHAYHAFGEALRPLLARAFPEREFVVFTDEESFRRGLPEVEAMVVLRPPRGHWGRAARLRLLQASGAGVDAILPAPDLPDGVRLANARGVHEPEMPEFVVALVMALAKQLPRAFQQQQRREWRLFAGEPLAGRTAGILGLGAIGASVARRLASLGMRVVGTRRSGAPLPGVAEVYAPDQTDRVLAQADVLVVLVPLTEETRGLVDAAALAQLKPGARLVNAARGGVVDEVALAEALESGHLASAAMDVFEEEPLPETSPLWSARGCLVTPHAAGVSRDYMERVGALFAENLRRLDAGLPPRNEVDRSRGY